jgi:hypothetical protein
VFLNFLNVFQLLIIRQFYALIDLIGKTLHNFREHKYSALEKGVVILVQKSRLVG